MWNGEADRIWQMGKVVAELKRRTANGVSSTHTLRNEGLCARAAVAQLCMRTGPGCGCGWETRGTYKFRGSCVGYGAPSQPECTLSSYLNMPGPSPAYAKGRKRR